MKKIHVSDLFRQFFLKHVRGMVYVVLQDNKTMEYGNVRDLVDDRWLMALSTDPNGPIILLSLLDQKVGKEIEKPLLPKLMITPQFVPWVGLPSAHEEKNLYAVNFRVQVISLSFPSYSTYNLEQLQLMRLISEVLTLNEKAMLNPIKATGVADYFKKNQFGRMPTNAVKPAKTTRRAKFAKRAEKHSKCKKA